MLSRTASLSLSGLLLLGAGELAHAQPGREPAIRLITLDPGHFHAALVQKTMYENVDPVVRVFAPAGSDVEDHLRRIEGFNSRDENPTAWVEEVYTGDDFLRRLTDATPGNVVVISGNNRRKADYILACVEAGLNVLADKPMCIDSTGYSTLQRAFEVAEQNDVFIYDIMTERSEITSIIQRELMKDEDFFGTLQRGTPEQPAIVKSSVHHFFKYVAGNTIKRPGWYFDTTQQGEGIVDVTTHLVDLIMWTAFPGETMGPGDIQITGATRKPTMISREQYGAVTRLDDFIDDLKPQVRNGVLPCFANGEIDFTVRGVHARVSVEWNYQAPPGSADTHFSMVRGTKAQIAVVPEPQLGFKPVLQVMPASNEAGADFDTRLARAIAGLQDRYPGIGVEPTNGLGRRITIPQRYRAGHEAHFADVMERYMVYLSLGHLPEWEVPNMLAKYATTTSARDLALEGK